MSIKKYMTPGIKDKIGLLIQVYIWEILSEYQKEKLEVEEELDYFQSFELSLNEDSYLEILHKEEVPNDYSKRYVLPDSTLSILQAEEYLGYIFVIANEEKHGFTMILANEY